MSARVSVNAAARNECFDDAAFKGAVLEGRVLGARPQDIVLDQAIITGFESTDIDTSTIPYQHKERETARKNKMEKVKKEKADMIAQEALDAAEDEDSDDEEVNQSYIMPLSTTLLCLCLCLCLFLNFCFCLIHLSITIFSFVTVFISVFDQYFDISFSLSN